MLEAPSSRTLPSRCGTRGTWHENIAAHDQDFAPTLSVLERTKRKRNTKRAIPREKVTGALALCTRALQDSEFRTSDPSLEAESLTPLHFGAVLAPVVVTLPNQGEKIKNIEVGLRILCFIRNLDALNS